MKLLDDSQITTDAAKRATYRLRGVTTKLNPSEVESVERLARSRGLQRGELIRKLILDELVYHALSAIDLSQADAATKYYVERQLLEFHLAGVDKDDATRGQLRKLQDELTDAHVRVG